MPRGPALWPDCSSFAKQKTVTAAGRPHGALVWPRSRASDPTTALRSGRRGSRYCNGDISITPVVAS